MRTRPTTCRSATATGRARATGSAGSATRARRARPGSRRTAALAGGRGGEDRAGRRARRPHGRSPFVTLDPRRRHRPRPGLRHRARPAATSCCTTPSPTSAGSCEPGDAARRGGVEARRHGVPARPEGPLVPGGAVGGRGQPAARRSPAGRGVHVRVDEAGERPPRRRRAGDRPQPRQAGLRRRVRPDDLPAGFAELAPRIEAAEDRRGAPAGRVPRPGAGARSTAAGSCASSPRRRAEDQNAALSLATNLAVADALLEAGTGLFRVMAEPTARAIERLRHTAHGVRPATGRRTQSLADFRRTLHRGDPACRRVPDRRAPRRRRGVLRWSSTATVSRSIRGTRRSRRRTSTRRRRCAGWPIATWSTPRWRSGRRAGPRPRRGGVRRAAQGDGAG